VFIYVKQQLRAKRGSGCRVVVVAVVCVCVFLGVGAVGVCSNTTSTYTQHPVGC
jgi:hypothetical protein